MCEGRVFMSNIHRANDTKEISGGTRSSVRASDASGLSGAISTSSSGKASGGSEARVVTILPLEP